MVNASNPNHWDVDSRGVVRQTASKNGSTSISGSNHYGDSQFQANDWSAGGIAEHVSAERDLYFAASDMCIAQEESDSLADELEIVVPDGYRGGLQLHVAGTAIDLKSWQGGELSFAGAGDFTLNVGDLMDLSSGELKELSSFTYASSGSGKSTIEAIETDDFQVTINGNGNLTIEGLQTRKFQLTQSGSGDTVIRYGSAMRGTAVVTGSGNLYLPREIYDNVVRVSPRSGKIIPWY